MSRPTRAGFLSAGDRAILEELARSAGYAPGPVADLIERLVSAEQSVMGMGRRHGIFERIRAYLEEAWLAASAGGDRQGSH